jgi:TonB family protein
MHFLTLSTYFLVLSWACNGQPTPLNRYPALHAKQQTPPLTHQPDGRVTVNTYSPDGQLRESVTYADSTTRQRHGETIQWYPNGKARMRETYTEGQLRERLISYPSGRKLLFEQFDNDGQLTLGRSFSESGAIVPYTPYNAEPDFEGGIPGLMQYINKQARYTPQALADNVEGRVFVQITIDTLGRVTQASLGKPLHPALDAEALRVARSLRFKRSARANGRAVTSTLTVPVTFKLK